MTICQGGVEQGCTLRAPIRFHAGLCLSVCQFRPYVVATLELLKRVKIMKRSGEENELWRPVVVAGENARTTTVM